MSDSVCFLLCNPNRPSHVLDMERAAGTHDRSAAQRSTQLAATASECHMNHRPLAAVCERWPGPDPARCPLFSAVLCCGCCSSLRFERVVAQAVSAVHLPWLSFAGRSATDLRGAIAERRRAVGRGACVVPTGRARAAQAPSRHPRPVHSAGQHKSRRRTTTQYAAETTIEHQQHTAVPQLVAAASHGPSARCTQPQHPQSAASAHGRYPQRIRSRRISVRTRSLPAAGGLPTIVSAHSTRFCPVCSLSHCSFLTVSCALSCF